MYHVLYYTILYYTILYYTLLHLRQQRPRIAQPEGVGVGVHYREARLQDRSAEALELGDEAQFVDGGEPWQQQCARCNLL